MDNNNFQNIENMKSNVSSNDLNKNEMNTSKFSDSLTHFAVYIKRARQTKYQSYSAIISFFAFTLVLFGYLFFFAAISSSDNSSDNSNKSYMTIMSIVFVASIYFIYWFGTIIFMWRGYMWECDNLDVNKHYKWLLIVGFLIPITGIVAYFFIVIKLWKIKKEYLANENELEAIAIVKRKEINEEAIKAGVPTSLIWE